MKRLTGAALAAVISIGASSVWAQGGPPGMGGPGGGGPSPEMMKMFQKMRELGEKRKNLRQVGMTMRALNEFEKDPKTALTKDQAKKIMGLVGPWRSKPVMTDDQAKTLNGQIAKNFTVPQVKKLAMLQKEMGRGFGGGGGRMGGGGGGFGGGRPGGGGPMGGGRPGGPMGGGGFNPENMKKMMASMEKGSNPLNPASIPDSPFKDRMTKPIIEALKGLEAKAK